MSECRYRFLFPIFMLPLAARSPAQEYRTWGPVQRTVRYEYRLVNPTSKAATRIDVFVPLPCETPRQKIHYLHYPEKGLQRVFTDRHGQRLLHYSIDRLEAGAWVDLGFVVGVTLRAMVWKAPGENAARNAVALPPRLRELYLAPETDYSMDSSPMRRSAAELTRGARSDYEKLVKIHDYITHKIRYVRDSRWDPAAVVLARGTGSCSEYNYVLSGLCRLAGLPTRCVGGTINGFRDLPTTDTVFHRWTEVYLAGYGWFPADCSRDANPIRGLRSHFGRVYTDALVWCRQAGAKRDFLGRDYRANARVGGGDPGLRDSHRARWYSFLPEKKLAAAYAWFAGSVKSRPGPDLLECALLHWPQSSLAAKVNMISALAAAGRNLCLWQAAALPLAEGLRERVLGQLCASAKLASTILDRSRAIHRFGSWFRSNEVRLVPSGKGRFKLSQRSTGKGVVKISAPPAQIWAQLAADVVGRLGGAGHIEKGRTVAVMPLRDFTPSGLGAQSAAIHAALEERIPRELGVRIVDEKRFERFMQERGPGQGEYWILANEPRPGPRGVVPEIVIVPLCITEPFDPQKGGALHHLELKVLELRSCRYFKIVARAYGQR